MSACTNPGSGVYFRARTTTETRTVTAIVTGTFTPTIRKYETQVLWNVQQGCVATQVGGRIWTGRSENEEDIEDVGVKFGLSEDQA
jgi:hypothetical protein